MLRLAVVFWSVSELVTALQELQANYPEDSGSDSYAENFEEQENELYDETDAVPLTNVPVSHLSCFAI